MSQDNSVLYIRELPGGGFVCVEGWPEAEGRPYHGMLVVERRSDPGRRAGHPPPAVVEADGPSQREVFDRLVSIASSNVAVAAALLRWQGRGGRDQQPSTQAPLSR
jgi:hypothetical protein